MNRIMTGKRRRPPVVALFALAVSLMGTPYAHAADERIAVLDTYGLVKVRRNAVLKSVGLRVGDREPGSDGIHQIEVRLHTLAGVAAAAVSVVRYRSGSPPTGAVQSIVYIGIREAGAPKVCFRPEPIARIALPDEVVAAYEAFKKSRRASLRRGDWSEDDSHGYALLGDEATRALQKQFVPLAERHFDRLAEVLRTANSAKQREMAATVLAFAGDKTKVAAELAAAARDPDRRVRNDATRALGVILNYARQHPELAIAAPVEPYLDLLQSLQWTDRNKAMFVLLELTEDGDASLLHQLAEHSLPALVEMARWSTEGHAVMAYLLVGRIAGLTDTELIAAWRDGKREDVIARAFESVAKGRPDKPAQ